MHENKTMKEKFKYLYDEYIGWAVLLIIIFPLGVVLDIKFIEVLKKLSKKKSKSTF